MVKFEIEAVTARRLLSVIPFASTDKFTPILSGVCLRGIGNELTVYATDRYKVARLVVPCETDLGEFRLIINAKEFAAAIKAVTPARGGAVNTTIEINEDIVRITDSIRTYELRAMDGEYPHMDKFFQSPNGEVDSVYLAPAAFKALADAARTFGKNATKFELRFDAPHKPVLATMQLDNDTRFEAAIMPIR